MTQMSGDGALRYLRLLPLPRIINRSWMLLHKGVSGNSVYVTPLITSNIKSAVS